MQSDIRKDSTKGSHEDSNKQGGEVRRSRRDRVPNNKYAESIEELRKVATVITKSVTGKDSKMRHDRNQNSEESSWSHRKGDEEDVNRSDGSEWMKCVVTDGPDSKPRLIELEVVCGRPARRKISEFSDIRSRPMNIRRMEEEVEDQPKKIVKKVSENNPAAKSNLLEILMMAAKKVAEEPEPRVRQSTRDRSGGSYNNEEETPMEAEEDQQQSQQVDDSDDRIARVSQHPDKLVFEHSHSGKRTSLADSDEVPMTWSEERPPSQQPVAPITEGLQLDNLQKVIAEYKRKVQTPLILT